MWLKLTKFLSCTFLVALAAYASAVAEPATGASHIGIETEHLGWVIASFVESRGPRVRDATGAISVILTDVPSGRSREFPLPLGARGYSNISISMNRSGRFAVAVFDGQAAGQTSEDAASLWILDTKTNGWRPFRSPSAIIRTQWSPDGKTLAVEVGESDSQSLITFLNPTTLQTIGNLRTSKVASWLWAGPRHVICLEESRRIIRRYSMISDKPDEGWTIAQSEEIYGLYPSPRGGRVLVSAGDSLYISNGTGTFRRVAKQFGTLHALYWSRDELHISMEVSKIVGVDGGADVQSTQTIHWVKVGAVRRTLQSDNMLAWIEDITDEVKYRLLAWSDKAHAAVVLRLVPGSGYLKSVWLYSALKGKPVRIWGSTQNPRVVEWQDAHFPGKH